MSDTNAIERATARLKSYTGAAVLVFILYWLFWIPGLIVNVMYYTEAKRTERLAGQSLPGVGCLTVMLWLNSLLAVIVVLGLCMLITVSRR
jgi:hypothetical protein